MNTKTLLIILVVIAIVVGVAIWRVSGCGRERPGTGLHARQRLSLFKWLGGGGDTLAIARLVGCNRNGKNLTFNGTCDARIMPSESRQSRFVLRPTVGPVSACYGFTTGQVDSCQANKSQGDLKSGKDKSRFVVTKDQAFLRLYCHRLNAPCTVTVE